MIKKQNTRGNQLPAIQKFFFDPGFCRLLFFSKGCERINNSVSKE